MSSERYLLKQENAKLVAKNAELKHENSKLKQIIKDNAEFKAKIMKLEQTQTSFEMVLTSLKLMGSAECTWPWKHCAETCFQTGKGAECLAEEGRIPKKYNKYRSLRLESQLVDMELAVDKASAQKGFQMYSKMDFESVEREWKRLNKHAGNVLSDGS
ncbi:15706_t:CDS:2 [Acaulospora morrowiae]|uniref:15706_t:CDS:1 n=1 Tax=Acaulospora morrowiae TaxID=94023 RepID=A0A9N9C1Q8_9GLOM|nr:15706_t:CDS:2 [Acaulospora morrowiae]